MLCNYLLVTNTFTITGFKNSKHHIKSQGIKTTQLCTRMCSNFISTMAVGGELTIVPQSDSFEKLN
jgi:hypothetical protein